MATITPRIRIPYEEGDELIHTALHPVCEDETCPCWEALRNDTAWKLDGNWRAPAMTISQDEAAQRHRWDDETGRNQETRLKRLAKRAYLSRDFRTVWLTRRNGRLTLCALLYGGCAAIVYGWDDNPENPGWNTMGLYYGPLEF